jgi:glyoxylase-like metal-dependent hydrolase (beta-lactamase superfamily II)
MTTFRVGDLTLHRVVEQEAPIMAVLDFFPTLTRELLAENRSWFAPVSLDAEDRLILCIQSYIIRTPHHTILIDTCVGNNKERPTRPNWHRRTDDTYMRGLAAHGLSVDDIDFVMCTHLHPDHVGWNTRLENGHWVPTFPRARYLFNKREYEHWIEQHGKTLVPLLQDSVLPIVAANRADLVTESHVIGDHVHLLSTPGHTPGHMSVLLGRDGTDAILTGDCIHTSLQARYPELNMLADIDPVLAAATRRSVLERCCDTRALCCTAHFPSPSRGRITRWGEGFRCDAVGKGV